MSTDTRNNLVGAALGLTAFAIFSTHDVVIKWLGGSYSAFQIVFFSVLFSFPLTSMLIIAEGAPTNLRPKRPLWSAVRSVAAVITPVCAFYAFSTLPFAQVYAILFAAPLLITLLAIPMLGEKVGVRRLVATAVGLCGVIIVVQPGSAPLEWGHLAAVVAAVSGAFASVIMRKIGKQETAAALLIYPLLGNLVLMGVAMPFVFEPMTVSQLGGQALIAVLSFIAMLFMIAAYRRAAAVFVAPMQYSQIIWASVFGLVLFGEAVELTTILGAAVIIGSGIFILLRENTSGVSSNTPVLNTRNGTQYGMQPRIGSVERLREARNKVTAQDSWNQAHSDENEP